MSNATHIPGLSTNLSHHHAIQGSMVAQGHGLGTAPTQHEAYAVGKVIRRAFDSLWQTLQKVWGQELSSQELAARKRFTLYRQGLRECVQQLGRALEQVLKNPYASGSIEKIHALMSHYNIYLQPSKDLQWQDYQQKAFKPLSEMVSQEADPRIRHAFRELLPILFQKEAENPDELKAKRSLQQSGGFPAVFDLATLNGTNGFTIPGIAVGGYLGTSLASGDINGDGIADLVLGANSVSSLLGEVYVVFGRVSGWPASFNIASLNGTNGFAIPGVAANGILGTTVSTADINGDGKTDLVLGADGVSSYTGVAYVIFGKANGWSASFDLTTLNGLNGFGIPGIAAGGNFGYSVSTAGDINKDGKDDLIIGGRLVAASSQGGAAYVIFGQAGGWPASFNLGGLNGVNGFGIPGIAANGNLGQSVSTAGDINGDGIGDLAIGAPTVGTSNGAVYVVFGRSSSWSSSFNLALLNGTNGFVVSGISASDNLFWVRAAGDINSDGKADLALGAQGASSGAGASYVIFGQASGWSSSFNLAALNGANGFAIPGAWIVDTAGDVNGDGLSDLVLGSYSGSGIAYVIFGKTSGWSASISTGTLNGANGFAIPGIVSAGSLGWSVSTAGDINRDGTTDLFIGAYGISSNTGAAYVLFGVKTPMPPTPISSATAPSTSTSTSSSSSSSSSILTSTSAITSTSATPSLFSTPISMTPVNSASSVPTAIDPTIPIVASVASVVVVGGVIGVVLLLRFKKKACFAESTRPRKNTTLAITDKAYA